MNPCQKSARKWVIASVIAMGFMGYYAAFCGVNGVELIVCVYMGLVIIMGLERCLRSGAKEFFMIPMIGWMILLVAVSMLGTFIAIPEFIRLLKIATKRIDK